MSSRHGFQNAEHKRICSKKILYKAEKAMSDHKITKKEMNFKIIFQLLLIIGSGESLAGNQLGMLRRLRDFKNQNYDLNKRTNFQHKTKTIVKQKTPDMGSLARILGQAAASHHEK